MSGASPPDKHRQRAGLEVLRLVGALLAAWVLSVPVAYIATVLLFPFWSWLESSLGIESVGHSGPDDWCFEVTYGACAVGLSWLAVRSARDSGTRPSAPSKLAGG